MNAISKLLSTWSSLFDKETLDNNFPGQGYGDKFSWLAQVFEPISIVLYVLMGLVAAAGAIYAIYLGVQLARADEQSKRDEAKKHLITVLIAIAVTVVLILFFNELMPLIVGAFILPAKA